MTAADTTPEHAAACAGAGRRTSGVYNAGPFTPWAYRADGAPAQSTLVFPGGLGGANWGGTAFDPSSATTCSWRRRTSARSAGWKSAKDGSPVAVRQGSARRPSAAATSTSDATACRLAVSETAMGPADRRSTRRPATSRGRCRSASPSNCPPAKQNTGRPALAGPIVTAERPAVHRRRPTTTASARSTRRPARELWVDQARTPRQRRSDDLSADGTASSTSRSSRPIRWWCMRCPEASAHSLVSRDETVNAKAAKSAKKCTQEGVAVDVSLV